ncbi:polysaccharide pyruvyl transferase family protein [Rossellomorea vietnamensis]|uniref:Polysaccharide pyruvyl transferase family protein n=1 Tax=Rossellomorea vietnamensis TaxID=218284 RepID=A0ACD4C469_9BACI|nr:polysaccharide pyruvyl transferase family protein [Rossellomorea vietnamensis]UXH43194.1 polysaccharide pyruvyl transferase family protein [Rossellomorea vietnamensis]
MKFLFINAYSAKNRGDAGIVVAMIHLIRGIYPGAEIKVMSSFSEENQGFYEKYNVNSVPTVWQLEENQSSIKRYINGAKILFKSLSKNSKHAEIIKESDVVISVGGGYLYSSRRGPLGIGLLNSLFHIWLAQKMSKKTIAFPQSVGPLNYSIDKLIVKKVLRKVDTFISRENITTNLLENLGLSNVIQIPDIGFTLPKKELGSEFKQFRADQINVGLTLLDWRFAKENSSEKDIDLYINKVSEACNLLLKEYKNCHFYIFPQVTVGENDSDLIVSKKLNAKLGATNSSIVNLDKIENFPEFLVDLYGDMDMFIGSRMHSTIFALAGGTPTIALAYQYKTIGTFKDMGLEKYTLKVDDFSVDDLYRKMNDIVKKQDFPVEKVSFKIREIETQLKNEIKKIRGW